ncbi:carbamoyl-phosphate synthase large subunit [Candidatus Vidania fulgoroideorum]
MKKKILIIGSGPIIIGQACEFDYSGVQACKVYKKLGYYLILLNNNPASIMTDSNIADKIYMEPMDIYTAKYIVFKEKPNYICPSFGGQTSLNLVLDLFQSGFLKRNNVKVLGTSINSIINSENRSIFRKIMIENNIPISYSNIANNIYSCNKIRKNIIKFSNNKQIVVRSSYTLGGLGSGIAKTYKKFNKLCKYVLNTSKEVLIEESLYGWKEIEIEVLIDKNNNYIVVCAIENIDSVGIHTGDSITVSPLLTITDSEYQKIRNTGFKILKSLGIKKCGCNIQFAINPKNGDLRVIEVNPRVSRSSALASKITGYPIAKITAKISLGILLKDIKNNSNKKLGYFFEPAIDYVAIKFPKFCHDKFLKKPEEIKLGTQMYSVGEIMAIGSSFYESISKAFRSNEDNIFFLNNFFRDRLTFLSKMLRNKSMLYYLYELIYLGFCTSFLRKISNIDIWYISMIKKIVSDIIYLQFHKKRISKNFLKKLKTIGFSDISLSKIFKINILEIIILRKKLKIFPSYRKIDTCSNEFRTSISYLYSSYLGKNNKTASKKKILVLGSGPNRVGQGLEFDYCCTHAIQKIKNIGYKVLVMNCNPETISTDYNISDKLFFEPLHYEDLYNLIKIEKPLGILIQYGGQTSLKFIDFLKSIKKENLVIGTNIKNIKISENRKKFRKFISKNYLFQPKSITISKKIKIKKISLKFPVLSRPSYVIGGYKIRKILNIKELNNYVSDIPYKLFPILVDEFLSSAFEFDIDCVCNSKKVFIPCVIQHIERAGIHSGDSTCFIPSFISNSNLKNLKKMVERLILKLNIIGLANIQIAIKKNRIYILEINARASRTIPFISKYYDYDIVALSISSIFKLKIKTTLFPKKKYFFIKEPAFSFTKFLKSDPILGPEMRSTGETSCFSNRIEEAFLKSQVSLKYIYIKRIFLYIKRNFLNVFTLKKYLKKIGRKFFFARTKNLLDFNLLNYLNFFKETKFHVMIQNRDFNSFENFFLSFFRTLIKNMLYPLFTTDEAIKCFFRSLFYFYNKKFKYLSSDINDKNI